MVNVIKDRNRIVMDAAIQLAKTEGYQFLTREAVAREAKVSTGTVSNAYGNVRELKRAVLREAVEKEIVEIIAQGMADRHPIVAGISLSLRQKAAEHIATAA